MNKTIYTAPDVEQIQVRLERNFLDSGNPRKVSGMSVNGVQFDEEADW